MQILGREHRIMCKCSKDASKHAALNQDNE